MKERKLNAHINFHAGGRDWLATWNPMYEALYIRRPNHHRCDRLLTAQQILDAAEKVRLVK